MPPNESPPVTLADPPRRQWSRTIVVVATAGVTALIGVGVWLFSPSELGELEPPPDLASYAYVDGVVSEVAMPNITLEAFEPVSGEDSVTFEVRDADARYFDVIHLRAHSSIGLPTRVYYEDDGERIWAVYKEDAPANSGGEG